MIQVVFDRVIAISIDGIIIIAFMFGASYIFSLFEGVPDWLRIAAFVFIFLLYDPLFQVFLAGRSDNDRWSQGETSI